ncbi:MAG: outer membrane beta-barrel protein [Paludibacter sp.]
MKTKSILGLLLVYFSLPLFAQEAETVVKQEIVTTTTTLNKETPTPKKAKWWVGPKFGLDISSSTLSSEAVKSGLNKNYQFGMLFQYGRTFYIQPEIYYVSYKITPTTINPATSSNYVKIPVMAGVKFLDLGLFSLHVTTGPSYSFKLDDKDGFTGTKGFSWLLGAGVDVLGFITSDIRYTLRDKVSIADQISQFSSASNTLNLTVGLKFR